MDPNLFAVDGPRLLEVLLLIVVLAFFVERALAIFFESRLLAGPLGRTRGLKELIAFGLAFSICWYWKFDALSVLMPKETITPFGEALTGAVIAGGSKASIKLFHDLMGVMSSAEKERKLRKEDGLLAEKERTLRTQDVVLQQLVKAVKARDPEAPSGGED